MADAAANQQAQDDERRRRERQEAMERMLLAAEEQETGNAVAPPPDGNNDNGAPPEAPVNADLLRHDFPPQAKPAALSYTTTSFLLALGTLWYALRTREQWYLALVFLGSSKVAYCVLGNALVAFMVVTFDVLTKKMLGGLRVLEAEGLQDYFRWNITETCLALTMFRQELTVTVAVQFLVLVLVKCLHHVTVLREQHLRMTADAVRAVNVGGAWRIPVIPYRHVKVLIMFIWLQTADLFAVQYTAQDLLNTGPSVSILFAFEAAILLVSAWSCILLWWIHVVDGGIHFLNDEHYGIGQALIHFWKEYKATLTFAVELQAQAVQFLFYLAFFGFVMTYYGMPINLFREVYVSFMALKERLLAFLKYRRLMASMNRFDTPTVEQLDEAGHICIICRDEMTVHDCKALPVCRHMFHKSCLREWLTQQQTCPTCRSDIASMEARQAAAAAANERQEQEEQPNEGEAQQQEPEAETVQIDAPASETTEALNVDAPVENRDTIPPPPEQSARSIAPAIPKETVSTVVPPKSSVALPKKASLSFEKKDPTLRFPALYRIVRERGTDVWNVESHPPSVVRRLPLGVVVFGKDIHGMELEGEMKNYIQVPDGWVADDAVFRVYDGLKPTS